MVSSDDYLTIEDICTLNPADLRGRPVPLVVPGRYPEYDCRLGAGVYVCGRQAGVGHDTLGVGPAEDADEGELAGRGAHRLGVPLGGGGGALDGQVHRVLYNVPGGGGRGLPREVGTVAGLGHLDGGRRAREAGQARLEGGHL